MQAQKNNLIIPASILLAGFLIAAGIYFADKGNNPPVQNNPTASTTSEDININPVSSSDHILGDPNAPIVIVEFSDTECPYCKMFQTTMQTIMDTYGKNGQVAWVYRYFPLDQLHSKSRNEAEAVECSNTLGGSTAFWKYEEEIYATTTSNNTLDSSALPVIAKDIGLNVSDFNTCLASNKYADLIQADEQDGINAGAQGTPYSVLILKTPLSSDAENTIDTYVAQNGLSQNVTISGSKKQIVMNGALPANMVETILDAILK